MKKILIIITLMVITGIFFILKNNNGGNNMINPEAAANESTAKTLVVYFSRTGEQYGVGNISEGNTAIIAKMIAKRTGADLFEIKVKNDNYPTSYSALTEYAQKEKRANARPEIIGKVKNFEDYNTIFIGYPNWWGDMPMPVYTFLESYDLNNKTVHHFCTHEGSGGVKQGFAIYGHIAQKNKKEAENQVNKWLDNLGF